jgi:glutaminyl-peptide cyclotransferase
MRHTMVGAALCTALLGCEATSTYSAGSAGKAPAPNPTTAPAAAPSAAAPVVTLDGAQVKPVTFDSSKAWEHLRQMVAIGPRPAGSAAIKQTRAYITRQLSAIGLQVEEQPFVANTPLGAIEMVNLIARLPGKRQERILFTGHYDTKLMKDAVFVGASDAGSSAAFLIELARVLKDQPREFTYEFVWFDGEEAVVDWYMKLPDGNHDNTYGSRYYVLAGQKARALGSIKAMILVDMIGDKNLAIRREQKSTTWLKDAIWGAAKKLGHGKVFLDEETDIDDDHVPFLNAGVPSVDIIDLDYPEWHTPADNLSAVSARSLQIVGDVLLAALPEITKRAAAGR